jgi:hypothetical protein
MGNLWAFFLAAGELGGGSVILAVVLLVISIIEHLRDENIAARWLAGVAGLAFCFGAYQAWQAEHSSNVDLRGKLTALTVPDLHPSFYRIATGHDKSGHTILFVWIEVTNNGAPSVATLEDISISQPGGRKFRAMVLPAFTKDTHIPNVNGVVGQNVTLERNENFQILMHDKPIERGEEPVGWLEIVVPDGTDEDVSKSVIAATMVDFAGNKVPFSKDISKEHSDFGQSFVQ